MRKKRWSKGDVFAIPLLDGSLAGGQVVSIEPQALNSVVCAFFARPPEPPVPPQLIAVQFVTRDLLDSGRWRTLEASIPLEAYERHLDLKRARKRGYVGVKINGSAIIETLLSAIHGLTPWEKFANPKFFDELLVSPDLKPLKPLPRVR